MTATRPDHDDRRRRLAASLAAEQLDAALVTNPVNVTYLTGFSGEASYLIVAGGRAVLVSDGRFTEQIAEECPGLDTVIRPPTQTITDAAGEALGKLAYRNVAVESGHLTLADFDGLRGQLAAVNWKASGDRVERLRAIKDASELAEIREAIRFAERAWAMFRAMLTPDDAEKQLSDAMEGYIRRAGGKCSSFPTIVAVGGRAALPHAPPTERRVREDPLLLVDWGASGRLYKSDLTRVLVGRKTSRFDGADESKLEAIYGVVLKAQHAAIAALRPGTTAGAIDAAARDVIALEGYGDYFTHSTGHGIGLNVHEAPLLKSGSPAQLQAGMVVTIEPGIYVSGWGGVRIEDDVLVTPDGCEVLTSVPKEYAAAALEW